MPPTMPLRNPVGRYIVVRYKFLRPPQMESTTLGPTSPFFTLPFRRRAPQPLISLHCWGIPLSPHMLDLPVPRDLLRGQRAAQAPQEPLDHRVDLRDPLALRTALRDPQGPQEP